VLEYQQAGRVRRDFAIIGSNSLDTGVALPSPGRTWHRPWEVVCAERRFRQPGNRRYYM